MTIDDFLGNAAVASQNMYLLEEEVTRGAVLRSLVQWLKSCEDKFGEERFSVAVNMMISEVRSHEDYDR